MNHTLPATLTKYKAYFVDHNGKYSQIGGIFDSIAAAQDALKTYFDKHPPQSVTDYDIGGYIERLNLELAYNPKTQKFSEFDDF